MKTVFKMILAAAMLCVIAQPRADAQQYNAANTTIIVAAAATVTNAVTATKANDIALGFSTTGAAGTTNLFTVERSLDGTNFETTPVLVVTNIASASTVRNLQTLDLGAIGYLRVRTTSASVATTTNVLTVATKPSRQGN